MHGEELEQTRDRTFDPLLFLVVLEHDFLTPSLETPTWSLGSPHAHRSSLDTEPLRRKSPLWQEHQGLLGSTTKVGTELGQARDPLLLGRLALCNPWTVTCQAPLSMGFPRQEYWSRLPFPSPGDLPDPGVEPSSPSSYSLSASTDSCNTRGAWIFIE